MALRITILKKEKVNKLQTAINKEQGRKPILEKKILKWQRILLIGKRKGKM
jgi:hypothetical protein